MKTVSILVSCLLLLFSCSYFLFHFRPGLPQKHQIQNIVEEIAPKPTEIIEETQLPDRHLIRTAFIPQSPEKNWDQPWQDACEEASLLNVYFYYQEQKPDIPQMLPPMVKPFLKKIKILKMVALGITHLSSLVTMMTNNNLLFMTLALD